MRARLVVGTGRCGSTLLTKMLDQHRSLLGLNEVFTGLDWGRRFTPESVDGAFVADVLGTPNDVLDLVLGKGYRAEEVTYRFRTSDRYRPGDDLPWILASTLGHLTDDPDRLWDELAAWLRDQAEVQPIGHHYRALFDHLATRAGKVAWVERSGSSVDYLEGLMDTFPDAQVVHLVRDGREVALSMREHAFYRLAVQLVYGVIPDGVDPDDEDAVVDGWLQGDPPPELFGTYWSDQLTHGAPTLSSLPSDRLLTINFEELCAAPAEHMERLAAFFELERDDSFVERAAGLVRGVPPSRFAALDVGQRERLSAACRPGLAVLAEVAGGVP